MAYDGIMMHQVIDDLNKTITGGRINKIYQISKYELLIQVRNNRTNYKLLLSCHPMYARIQLTNLDYPTPESPNPLTMLFRKHLEGGYIKKIEQIELFVIFFLAVITNLVITLNTIVILKLWVNILILFFAIKIKKFLIV